MRELREAVQRLSTAPHPLSTLAWRAGRVPLPPPGTPDASEWTTTRVNTSTTPIDEAHALEALGQDAEKYTAITPDHLRIAGRQMAKSFVMTVGGVRSRAIQRVAELIRELRDDAVREISVPTADGSSRQQFRDGEVDLLARLDHAYVNTVGGQCQARYTEPMGAMRATSDHSPNAPPLPGRSGAPSPLAPWVAPHPAYAAVQTDSGIALLTQAMHDAAASVKRAAAVPSGRNASAGKVHWALCALSAYQKADSRAFFSALHKVPESQSHFVDEHGLPRETMDVEAFEAMLRGARSRWRRTWPTRLRRSTTRRPNAPCVLAPSGD